MLEIFPYCLSSSKSGAGLPWLFESMVHAVYVLPAPEHINKPVPVELFGTKV
jgi:hypothetical protein